MKYIITALKKAFAFTSPAVYPRKPEMAVPRLKEDLNFVASRYIEVVIACSLLRAGHGSLANGDTAKGEALIAKGEALYLNHLSARGEATLCDCWKQQEMHRILGGDAETIGYHAGLRD
jgi:hypothetical protein